MARPPFKPTAAQRVRVAILAAARMSKIDIALSLDIDPKTLDKHFAEELTIGAAKKNAEIHAAMFKAATKGGNVAAQKAWLARHASPEGSLETLGKKEQREAEAKAPPPGEWEGLVKH